MRALVPPEVLLRAVEFDDEAVDVPTGPFNIKDLARRYLDYCRKTMHLAQFESGWEPLHWVWECVRLLVEREPELALACIKYMIVMLSTKDEAGIVGAGFLEDLIHKHGDRMIAAIEEEASASARFRFVLSGVWPQGKSETEVWQRVLRARAAGPDMDAGDPLPPA